MSILQKSSDDLLWALRQVRPLPSNNDQNTYRYLLGYVVFLGAGASVEAGIPSADALVQHALRSRRSQNREHALSTYKMSDADIEDWAREKGYYDPTDERSKYAQVMDNLFHTAVMRQEFVRHELRKARVSDGYRILGELINRWIFDTILTTNFDNLIRQGADAVSPSPINVVASPEEYNRLKSNSIEQRVIRLHGDFWHGNILNTEDELNSTPKAIFDAVARLFKDYGAIVIGYGGADSSVMSEIFRYKGWKDPDFLSNGLYWCDIKEVQDLSPKVKSFLSEGAKVGRAFYVKIEGFNSLMRDIGAMYGVNLSLEQDMEKDMKKYWEWFDLISDLSDGVTRKADNNEFRQRNLESLVKLLAAKGAICASRYKDSGKWEVSAAPRRSLSISSDEAISKALEPLHQKSEDYQKSSSADLSVDNIFYEFLREGTQIETFPVWRGEQLFGLVSFASNEDLLVGDQRLRLIRSAVKLLVAI